MDFDMTPLDPTSQTEHTFDFKQYIYKNIIGSIPKSSRFLTVNSTEVSTHIKIVEQGQIRIFKNSIFYVT
jgi:hypothetical protein